VQPRLPVLLFVALLAAAGCAPAVESGPSPIPTAPPPVAHATIANGCWIDTAKVVSCSIYGPAGLAVAELGQGVRALFGNPAAYTFGAEDGQGVFRCFETTDGTTHTVVEVHAPDASPLVAIVCGSGFTCGLAADGRASCTGAIPTTGWGATGPTVPGLDASGRVTAFGDKKAIDLRGGVYQVCGLLEDGSVVCFGNSGHFTLGAEGQKAPVAVPAIAPDIVQLGVGHDLACARSAEGEVFCWGQYIPDEVGPGAPMRIHLPEIVDLVVGEHNACARDKIDTVWCWGDNEGGESGPPIATPPPGWVAPQRLIGVEGDVVELGGGPLTFFARTSDGKIWGWGDIDGLDGAPQVIGSTSD
jgi:alpha-tubulin suppressor-like RCC1 family protein